MTCLFTCIFAILLASISSAATITPVEITASVGMQTTGSVPSPQSIQFKIKSIDSLLDSELIIPNITPTNEGDSWIINESNSAIYGMNWLEAQQALGNPLNAVFTVSMNTDGPLFLLNQIEDSGIVDFVLQNITLTLDRFLIGSISEQHVTAKVNGHIVTVPEVMYTSIFLLGLVGALFLARTR